jgi:hypothetical protein
MGAEVFRIDRRRNAPVRRVLNLKHFRTRHLLGNGALIRDFDRPLFQSVAIYRHGA